MASDRFDDEYADDDRPRRRGGRAADGKAKLLGPAIGLLVTGVLSALVGGVYLAQGLSPAVGAKIDEEMERRKQEVDAGNLPADQKQAQKDGLDVGAKLVKTVWVPGSAVVTLGGLVITLGGVQGLRARGRGLVMTSSILAMIPCFSGLCCPLGLPIGIWALVTLGKPEVKAAFAAADARPRDDYDDGRG